MSVHNIQESNALLLYKVGPVFVCSPTMPVEAVTIPPKLTVPPGSSVAEPGLFKSIHGMVRLVDLRVRFGVEKGDMNEPGKIIIVEVEGGHAGFWVDEIEDVISFPTKGWSQVPAYIPRNVFSRTLIEEENIRLYADFEQLDKFKSTGYLRKHIEMIKVAASKQAKNKNTSTSFHHKTKKIIEEKTTDNITAGHITTDNVATEQSSEISKNKSNNETITQVKPLDEYVIDKRKTGSTQTVSSGAGKADNASAGNNENNLPNTHHHNDKTKQVSEKEISHSSSSRSLKSESVISNKNTSNITNDHITTEELFRKSNVKSASEVSAHVTSQNDTAYNKRDISATHTVKAEIEKADNTSSQSNRSIHAHANKPDITKSLSDKKNVYHPEERRSVRQSESNNYSSKNENNNLHKNRKPAKAVIQKNSVVKKPEDIRPSDIKYSGLNSDEMKPNEIKPGEIKQGEIKSGEARFGKTKPGEIEPQQQENSSIVWIGLLALMAVVGVYFLLDSIELGNNNDLNINKKRIVIETLEYTEKRNIAEVTPPDVSEKEIKTVDPIIRDDEKESEPESEIIIVESDAVEITKNDDGLLIVVNDVIKEDELIENSIEANDYDAYLNDDKGAVLESSISNNVSEKNPKTIVEDKIEIQGAVEENIVEKINIENNDELDVSTKMNAQESQEPIEEQVVIQSKGSIEHQIAIENKEKIDSQKVIEDEPVKIIKTDDDSTGLVLKDRKEAADKPNEDVLKNKNEVTDKSSKKFVHVVVKGDTLWFIAKRYVHNPWRYPELAKLSNIKNPDLIYPGDQVTIIINYKRVNK